MTTGRRMLVAMEVLTMNVTELSIALQRMALETPDVILEPYADGTLVSDEFDVAVTVTPPAPLAFQIAEPNCGNAILRLPQEHVSESLWSCHAFISSLQPRRDMLAELTTRLIAALPDFPRAGTHVDIFRLAELCNMHVTTVSRTIQGKTFRTPFGLIPCSQFITNMRK